MKAWAARLQIDHGLAPGTALNAVRALSKALSDAIEDGLLDKNGGSRNHASEPRQTEKRNGLVS